MNSYAQQNNKVYDSIVNILLKEQATKFKRLDKSLRKFKRDTLYMRDFLERCEDANYLYGQIYANNMLGRTFRNKSLYDKAALAHSNALNLAKKTKDTLSQVYSLNMLGVVYRRQDAVKIALDYHFKALELANGLVQKDKQILKNISIAENSIGNIFNLLENYDLALKHHKKALLIEEKANNRLGMAINYQNIGSIYESQGNLNKALSFYNKSLKLNEAINSNVGRIICNNSIGSIYLKQQKPQKAIDLMIPTIALANKVGDNFYKSMASINLGRAYGATNDYAKANKYLKAGLQLSLDNNYSSATSEAYYYLSALEEKKGNYRQALVYTKKYGEYENRILNSKNQQYVNDLIVKVKNKEKNQQIKSLDEENQAVKSKLDKTKKQIYFGVALLILLSILGSIFYAQNKLNDHRKYVELKQNLMRTQMNPHFIFNALNSIKLYIINNEKEQAVYYLNKFSKLIRIILNSSRQKEISLKEELKNSELYVQIENIRFDNSVNFTVSILDEIELEEINIPPLILQPFLENAIWHGLSLKKGEKNLRIELINDKKNSCININIIDNGIGRAKAMEKKKNRIHNKKSLGIQLTKDRLKAFMKEHKRDYSIKIEDLFDNENKPKGTKIIIRIPFN